MGLHNASAGYRELGEQLRLLRERAGISGAELARRLAWPPTMVSRMESGKRDSTTVDVVMYAVACGLTLPQAEPLLELTRLSERRQGYWLSDKRIGGSLQSLIFHESSASGSIIYEPQVIPGLLQTADYTRARIAAREPELTDEELAGAVRTREERRRILHWKKPRRFAFYVAEQALRLQVGSGAIMHEQLLHIVLTSALQNVALRVVPSAAGEWSAFGGPFRLMEYEQHAPVVYLDHVRVGGLFLEDRAYVESYYGLLPMLTDVALDEGESREFAAELADAYDRGSQPHVAHRLEEEQL